MDVALQHLFRDGAASDAAAEAGSCDAIQYPMVQVLDLPRPVLLATSRACASLLYENSVINLATTCWC